MPVTFLNDKKILDALFGAGAVRFDRGQVRRFKSGIFSPGAYNNNRVLASHPDSWKIVRDALEDAGGDPFSEADVLVAIATGGIAHGAAIAAGFEMPFMSVRLDTKQYGLGGKIDGDENELAGAKVLLLEDMSSTFGSALQAMKPLIAAGATVTRTIAISSWGFPVFHQNTSEHDVVVLCDGHALVNRASDLRRVDEQYRELLHQWIDNPDDQSWIDDSWTMPS